MAKIKNWYKLYSILGIMLFFLTTLIVTFNIYKINYQNKYTYKVQDIDRLINSSFIESAKANLYKFANLAQNKNEWFMLIKRAYNIYVNSNDKLILLDITQRAYKHYSSDEAIKSFLIYAYLLNMKYKDAYAIAKKIKNKKYNSIKFEAYIKVGAKINNREFSNIKDLEEFKDIKGLTQYEEEANKNHKPKDIVNTSILYALAGNIDYAYTNLVKYKDILKDRGYLVLALLAYDMNYYNESIEYIEQASIYNKQIPLNYNLNFLVSDIRYLQSDIEKVVSFYNSVVYNKNILNIYDKGDILRIYANSLMIFYNYKYSDINVNIDVDLLIKIMKSYFKNDIEFNSYTIKYYLLNNDYTNAFHIFNEYYYSKFESSKINNLSEEFLKFITDAKYSDTTINKIINIIEELYNYKTDNKILLKEIKIYKKDFLDDILKFYKTILNNEELNNNFIKLELFSNKELDTRNLISYYNNLLKLNSTGDINVKDILTNNQYFNTIIKDIRNYDLINTIKNIDMIVEFHRNNQIINPKYRKEIMAFNSAFKKLSNLIDSVNPDSNGIETIYITKQLKTIYNRILIFYDGHKDLKKVSDALSVFDNLYEELKDPSMNLLFLLISKYKDQNENIFLIQLWKFIDEYPYYENAYRLLAYYLTEKGDVNSLKYLIEKIKNGPKYDWLNIYEGFYYDLKKDYSKVKSIWEYYFNNFYSDNNIKLIYNLGILSLQDKDFEKANYFFQKAKFKLNKEYNNFIRVKGNKYSTIYHKIIDKQFEIFFREKNYIRLENLINEVTIIDPNNRNLKYYKEKINIVNRS